MTSWLDVSVHDLHGVHQIALGGQQNRTNALIGLYMVQLDTANHQVLRAGKDWCRQNAAGARLLWLLRLLHTQHGYSPLLHLHCLTVGTSIPVLSWMFRWKSRRQTIPPTTLRSYYIRATYRQEIGNIAPSNTVLHQYVISSSLDIYNTGSD